MSIYISTVGLLEGTTLDLSGLASLDGGLQLAAGADITFTGTTGTNDITLVDDLADALSITRAGTDMIVFDTDTPRITVTPVTTFTGAITANGGVVGNLTGNASGTAATVTTASQGNITTLNALTSFGAAGATTDVVAGDVTMYNAVNDGNPTISIGSSSAERLLITSSYVSGGQLLDYVKFSTVEASSTANRGKYIFDVDGTDILTIDDGGIDLASGKTFAINGSDLITTDTTYTPGDGLDLSGTEFSVDLKSNGGLEIQSTELSIAQGISEHDVAQFGAGVADADFLKVDGTTVVGRSTSEVLGDIGGQASLTFGISNTNAVKIDGADIADDEYARFTANGLESRTAAEVAADIEGSIDAVGTIASGTWQGTPIATAYVADDAITSAKIADDAVVSAAIADDAVVTAAIADNAITNALMADNAIDSAEIVAGAIDAAHMSANSVDSDQYVDGSVDADHIADGAVIIAKLANGTDGQIITWDANAAPTTVGPGSAGEVLTSAGAGQPPAFAAASGGGITRAEMWRTTSNQTVSGDTVLTNWELNDTAGAGVINQGITHSSGVFTFPETGIWKMDVMLYSDKSGTSSTSSSDIQMTTDNSSYVTMSAAYQYPIGWGNMYMTLIFDVTNTSNDKVQIRGGGSSVTFVGNTDISRCGVAFIRLGDT